MASPTHKLPSLGYSYDALEPAISAQIMDLHHSKHHATYVANLNAALASYSSASVPDQIALQAAIKFNGGGHINHSLFWANLTPASSPDANPQAAPQLIKSIGETWGSVGGLQAAVKAAALGIQGSGWVWLVREQGGKAAGRGGLRIVPTKDQDPVVGGEIPIIGIDMWEHAYYLQARQFPLHYLNGKASYIDNIWSVINWKTAEERFLGGREEAFSVLKSSL
ncbi:manganese and iron superoxide dismutase [Zalerion maritima]|uniref:Superoxide dismutase n=1 Tax=Zalerion maritima TaxID=339359 RepID=A0AAD5RJB4_9PEZI|nr:manganese and iron superoxide dismutase [Zalerion maritima]